MANIPPWRQGNDDKTNEALARMDELYHRRLPTTAICPRCGSLYVHRDVYYEVHPPIERWICDVCGRLPEGSDPYNHPTDNHGDK